MNSASAGLIAVIGTNGQVSRALMKCLGRRAIAVTQDQADLSHPETLGPALDSAQTRGSGLSAVINAAAYTQVDLAEKERDLAFKINAESPGAMAKWCASRGVPFVHFSTDYVYPGDGDRAWKEEDTAGPLSAYGLSKLEGDRAVAAAGGRYLIFRTSWVYDAEGKNFVNTMLRLGAERETLRVVSDQIGAPTYAPHLAQAAIDALAKALAGPEFPSGIYHLCNTGETNWHEFAQSIFALAREKGRDLKVREVEAIPSSAYSTPAARPRNSRLDTSKARRILGVELPSWRQGLQECMAENSGNRA